MRATNNPNNLVFPYYLEEGIGERNDREGDKSMEKLKKLMNSYVPEFAYEPGASDPGSVRQIFAQR